MYSAKHIINRIPEETWAELNTRFLKHEVDYQSVLSMPLYEFLHNKATSVGTNIGYLLSSMIATTNFLAARNQSHIEIRNDYKINLNTFMIFVGQPSTGKSPAIKLAVSKPLPEIQNDQYIMSTATTSALTKFLANQNCAYIVNRKFKSTS